MKVIKTSSYNKTVISQFPQYPPGVRGRDINIPEDPLEQTPSKMSEFDEIIINDRGDMSTVKASYSIIGNTLEDGSFNIEDINIKLIQIGNLYIDDFQGDDFEIKEQIRNRIREEY